MMDRPNLDAFDRLPTRERIRVLQDLWDRIAENPDQIGVPDDDMDEILRRVAEDDRHPDEAVPWEQARHALRTRSR